MYPPVPQTYAAVAVGTSTPKKDVMTGQRTESQRLAPPVEFLLDYEGRADRSQMIDSAAATGYGGSGISVWTLVDDSTMNPENHVYAPSNPPVWIPELQEAQSSLRVLLYLHELSDMRFFVGTTERPEQGCAASRLFAPSPCRNELQLRLPYSARRREARVFDSCGRLVTQAGRPGC